MKLQGDYSVEDFKEIMLSKELPLHLGTLGAICLYFSKLNEENKSKIKKNLQEAQNIMKEIKYLRKEIKDLTNKRFKINKKIFDIIFIDGLHEAEQVKRDIGNSVKHLKKT